MVWEFNEEESGLVIAPTEETADQMPELAVRFPGVLAGKAVVLQSTEDAWGSGDRYRQLLQAVRWVFQGLQGARDYQEAIHDDVESALNGLKL